MSKNKYKLDIIPYVHKCIDVSLITFFIKEPVVSSAAIPCAAQKIDLNGFLLNQEWFIETIDFKESKYFSLTPQKNADGSWKNKKKVYFIEFI